MRKLLQTKKTSLSYSISDSATALRLTNLLKLDGSSVSASDIGDILYGTFDPGTSREEIFSIIGTNVTINSDGTVDITGVVRGLKEVSPYTTGGFATDHPAGAVVVFGNNPQVFNQMAFLDNENTFTEQNLFEGYAPQTDQDPLSPNDLTRLSYVQALVLGTLTTINVIVPGKAGETLVAGNLVYFDETDNEWKKCDADTPATVNNVLLGIAQGAGTDGNPITDGVLLQGLDENQSGLIEGDVYYASNTAGGISNTPGTTEVSIGLGKSTTTLYFAPRFNQQVTENEQDALVGNNIDIPVGAGNKYVTQTGLQHNAEKYAPDTSGSSTDYTIALSPVPISYSTGMVVYAKIVLANTTTTPTLNVNGLGAKTIVKYSTTPLAVGDIGANSFITLIYDGTNLVLQNPIANLVNPYPYVLNTTVDQVTHQTFSILPVVAGTISTLTNGWIRSGWTMSADQGGAGTIGLGIATDGYTLARLPSISASQDEFRFNDIGASEIRIKHRMKCVSLGSGERIGFGLANQANDLQQLNTYTAQPTIRFLYQDTGTGDKLWAVNSSTTAQTSTDITGALTLTNFLILEMVITSTSIKFYVNGTLVATHTTNIPATGSGSYIGWGGEYNGVMSGSITVNPIFLSLPM